MAGKRFVALDRDGTMIVDSPYLTDPDKVELLPGAARGLRRLVNLGLGLVLVTNQSAVGRGMMDLARLDLIHRRLDELLADEDICLDGVYFCPHAPEAGCSCRKPRTGMLELAAKELDFELSRCIVIGDKASDVELGQRVGATTILVGTGCGEAVAEDWSADPDYTVDGLWEAAQVIEHLLTSADLSVADEFRS